MGDTPATVNQIISSLQTAFTSAQGEMMQTLAMIIPIVLVVITASIVVRWGIRNFRGLVKQS